MSAFSDDVIAALAAPLGGEHVKQREQGRGKVSYVEGWHVIAEANRIFGFDGWTRETVMSECCSAGEYEKAVWENGRRTDRTVTSFRCSYRARVRVTVGHLVREGTGHGHGFADNPGEAHESAEKEAETDAMKRAFMTFGNPFGLALYDKAQAEVAPVQQKRAAPPAGARNAAPPSQPQSNGNVAPATRSVALPPSPEEPPEIGIARTQFKLIAAEFREAITEEQITDEKRGIWARNKDLVENIRKHAGTDAIAKLHEISQARIDQLREMFPAKEAAE